MAVAWLRNPPGCVDGVGEDQHLVRHPADDAVGLPDRELKVLHAVMTTIADAQTSSRWCDFPLPRASAGAGDCAVTHLRPDHLQNTVGVVDPRDLALGRVVCAQAA